MTLENIKEAIEQLPPEDQTILANWLSDCDWMAWDKQIEHDFSGDGPGLALLAELESELPAGITRPMEEGLAERRRP